MASVCSSIVEENIYISNFVNNVSMKLADALIVSNIRLKESKSNVRTPRSLFDGRRQFISNIFTGAIVM
jgi:hypothetical protein